MFSILPAGERGLILGLAIAGVVWANDEITPEASPNSPPSEVIAAEIDGEVLPAGEQ